MLIIVVALTMGVVNLVCTLNVVRNQKDNTLDFANVTMLEDNDDSAKTPDKTVIESKSKRDVIADNIDDVNAGNKELIETAESSNLVYRPLFVYRKIQHSKRRITMFNSFAG